VRGERDAALVDPSPPAALVLSDVGAHLHHVSTTSALAQPSGSILRNGAAVGTIAILKSDRADGPLADERNGDEAQVRDRAVLAVHPLASKRPQP
jgi:hypothetical protein